MRQRVSFVRRITRPVPLRKNACSGPRFANRSPVTPISGAACFELSTPRGGFDLAGGNADARQGQPRNARSRRRSAHLRSRKRSSARRVSAVSREKKRADAVRVRLRDFTRALGRSGPTWRGWRTPSAGCRIQGSREHPGRLRAVGGIRGGSPPRISLRGSKRLSTREDVARGAHVGRDSRVRHPCRSRGWKGNASLDPRPRNVTNL